MKNLFQNFFSFFKKKESAKAKVCWDFLADILGEILLLSETEKNQMGKLDDQDPKVLREIILEYVIPHYRYFSPENKEKIKNTLAYYLATNSEKLKWVFPSYQIPIDDSVAKLFYLLIWQELYGTKKPDQINPEDYVEDCSDQYSMSLTWCQDLKKKYNPEDTKPSITNVIARIDKQQ